MFHSCKSHFQEENDSSLSKISVSCTSQKYDNVTTAYYISIVRSIICQLVSYRRLKTKENFKLLVIHVRVVAVAYER